MVRFFLSCSLCLNEREGRFVIRMHSTNDMRIFASLRLCVERMSMV